MFATAVTLSKGIKMGRGYNEQPIVLEPNQELLNKDNFTSHDEDKGNK